MLTKLEHSTYFVIRELEDECLSKATTLEEQLYWMKHFSFIRDAVFRLEFEAMNL